jgi:hypothetical protein
VCATALLATYGTGNQLRAELAGDASLLETDSDILDALFTYANEHRGWAGVDSVVRSTGRWSATSRTSCAPRWRTSEATSRPRSTACSPSIARWLAR